MFASKRKSNNKKKNIDDCLKKIINLAPSGEPTMTSQFQDKECEPVLDCDVRYSDAANFKEEQFNLDSTFQDANLIFQSHSSEADSNNLFDKISSIEIKKFQDEKKHRINRTDGKARNKNNKRGPGSFQKHRKGRVPIEYIENPLLRASTKHKRSLTLLKKVITYAYLCLI